MPASALVAAAAGILLLLGVLHLKLTYAGRKLWPRDDTVRASMQDTSPRISDALNFWQAWISFNASHSLGAMLFGLVYGYLAIARLEWLRASLFLQAAGLLALLGYSWLGYRYWFSIPRRSVWAATACYAVGMVMLHG